MKEYLSPAEVAEITGTNRVFIYSLVHEGKLPAVRLSEGQRPRLRIARVDLDAFMAARRVTRDAA